MRGAFSAEWPPFEIHFLSSIPIIGLNHEYSKLGECQMVDRDVGNTRGTWLSSSPVPTIAGGTADLRRAFAVVHGAVEQARGSRHGRAAWNLRQGAGEVPGARRPGTGGKARGTRAVSDQLSRLFGSEPFVLADRSRGRTRP